jgi:hypothetical protein
MIWPSLDADSRALKERDTASTVTGARWPKSDPIGCKSTALEVAVTVHKDIVQSAPQVTRVLESAKLAWES